LFVHVTVPPTVMATGFGAYAVVVSTEAPATIDTLAAAVAGVGDGVGDEGRVVEEDPPQPVTVAEITPIAVVEIRSANVDRHDMFVGLLIVESVTTQSGCPRRSFARDAKHDDRTGSR